MKKRHPLIKNWKELKPRKPFSYNGSKETHSVGVRLSDFLGLERLGIWHETLKPGNRTSWPHAHKLEEEFVFVLEGTPEAWIDGEIYKLKAGDAIGFPPKKGHAHTIINNSSKVARLLVVGEVKKVGDTVFYPLHEARNKECRLGGYFWHGHPKKRLGKHDGMPDKLRRSKVR